MSIYEKPAWQLMRDEMVEDLEIKKGDIFSRKTSYNLSSLEKGY